MVTSKARGMRLFLVMQQPISSHNMYDISQEHFPHTHLPSNQKRFTQTISQNPHSHQHAFLKTQILVPGNIKAVTYNSKIHSQFDIQ